MKGARKATVEGRLGKESEKERSLEAGPRSAPRCAGLWLPLPTADRPEGSLLHQAVDLCEQHVRLRLWGDREKPVIVGSHHPAASGGAA